MMMPWGAVAAGTAFTAFAAYITVRRAEGSSAVRRRLPLITYATAATALLLTIVARTSPAEWWNYLLIPGSVTEWCTVLSWSDRRRADGGIRVEFRRSPNRSMLLVLAGMALFSGFMDVKTGGVSISNLLLFAVGASNLAVFLAVERSRPGITENGLLLLDRSVPWTSITSWSVVEGDRPALEVRVRSKPPEPERLLRFELRQDSVEPAKELLRRRIKE